MSCNNNTRSQKSQKSTKCSGCNSKSHLEIGSYKIIRNTPNKSNNRLFFVILRQPKSYYDLREDPMYVKGTFGTQDCHQKSILSEKSVNYALNIGDRFVFLQGGYMNGGSTFKIAYITSPIELIGLTSNNYRFVYWNPNKEKKPLKFEYQLNLLETAGKGKFTSRELKILDIMNPKIRDAKIIDSINRKITKAQRIGSCLRTMYKKVEVPLNSFKARKIIEIYNQNIEKMVVKHGNTVFMDDYKDTFQY